MKIYVRSSFNVVNRVGFEYQVDLGEDSMKLSPLLLDMGITGVLCSVSLFILETRTRQVPLSRDSKLLKFFFNDFD